MLQLDWDFAVDVPFKGLAQENCRLDLGLIGASFGFSVDKNSPRLAADDLDTGFTVQQRMSPASPLWHLE